ncbi:MAG: hypothetical protein OXF09_05920, partial [Hyphomicrobiales bacterium]|nr:hypothetical protein [Hyphomicrobiales bacterium]
REGDGTATLRVVLTNPVSEDVIVTLSESGDTNNEVSFAPGSLTFAPGDTSKDVTLTVVDDNRVEPGATITYTLALAGTPPDDVSLGTRDHVVTFIDDDSSTIGFTAASSTLSEGDSTTNLTVELSAPVSQDVMVVLTESGDDNNDLIISPETLTFAPGETDKQVTLTVNASNNDNKVEGDVQITYTLTGSFPDDVTLGTREHVVTFTDDDTSIVGFASGSSTLREGDGTATLRVELTNPVSEDVVLALSESGDEGGEVSFTPNSLTFASGETSHNVTLTVVDDNRVEPGATITYTLTGSLPDDVSLGTDNHVVAFIDDDSSTIGFTTASSTLREDNGTATLRVVLTNPVSEDVIVTLSESGDTNNEVSFAPGSLTFTSGQTSKEITLTVVDDNTVEPGATITYTLTGTLPDDVTLGTREHVVTFMDDDSSTIGFSATSSTLSEGDSSGNLTVSLSAPVSQDVIVTLTESGDDNNDLTFSPSSLTFAPGETSHDVTLTVNTANNDNKVEEDVEITYTLTGTPPDDVSFGTSSHVVTFADDDSSEVGFASGSSTLREDDGNATLRVVLSNPVSQDVIVTLTESGDTNDQVAFTPNSLTFAGGETSHNVTLTVVDDNTVEPGATITYTLTGTLPDDVSLGTRDHVVTFIDDDSATIGFATALSTLSESDNTNTLTISLSAPSAQAVTVTLTESGDDNNDLIISPETLTFAPGVMDKQVTLTVNAANNDNKVEEDVDITYTLTGAFSGNVRLDASRNTHVVTFTDDDSATVGFTSSSSTLSEDETSTASLTVSLSAEVSQEVVVDMTESGDGNSDLEFAPTSLTFAPGETSKQVTLTVNAANNDNKVEGDVQITYTLTGSFPDDVTLGTREHVVTFTDDDSATVGFASGSSTLSEDDGTATLRVVLSNPVSEDVVLALNESGDANNEVAFTPSSLTFASGQTSKEITLTVENDNKVEPGATIIYTLTGSLPDDVTLDIREHMVTLTDDDSATVGFTSSSSTLSEGDSSANLTVSLSAEVSQDVVVTLTESGDDNNDLEFAPTSLTFAPGERSKQVTLTVNAANNDNKVEEDVEITYTLAGAFSGNVGLDTSRTTHVVTFTDDDASIVGFASSSSALSENDGTEILSVVLTNPVSQDVIVTLTESGDINNQVAFTPNSLTFAGGETSHNVTLTVVDDKTVEPGATITYTLTGSLPDDVSLGAREHVVTLTDDDTSIIGFASSGSTLREGDGTATLSVVLTNPVSEDVVVTLNESGDGNDDLTFSPSSLLFTPGETSHNVTLTVSSADDNRVEEDVEITYTLTGSNLPADVSLSTSSHVVTFADDDSATVGFASGSSTLRENEGTATLRVELTNPVSEDVIVTLSESGDVNDQVAFSPSSVIFASGQTSKEITLTVVDDNTVEPGATITYTLAGTLPGNLDVSFGTRDHVVTFIDDDSSTIGFTTALSTLSEGDSTTNLTVELSAPSAQLVTVTLTESGDGNNDLTFSPDSLTFTPGERSKQVTLSVNASNNDNKVEEDVEITYTLTGTFSGSVRLDASRTTHVVTFTDDDSATVGFASSSSTLSEDETSTASLTVSLSAEVSQGVVVDLTESGDDNGDLIISPETLTFAPGETSKQVTLTVNTANNDTAPEGDVEITYTLGGTLPDDVSLGTREHVVTFTDDDKTISFKEFSSSASEGTIGHSVAVVLNFDPPAEGLEVSAVAKGDHKDDVSIPLPVLNFTGSTRELPVLVDVLDDIEQEDAEVVQLELEETSTPLPLGWTLIASGDNDHDLTIEPNDKTIGFADTLPAEIEEGAGDLPLEIVWNAPISHSVSLDLGVELEKADDGDSQNDVTLSAFVTTSQTPSMITEYDTNAYIPRFYSNQPASGSSQRLTIRVVDDAIAEEDEEVIVRLVPQEGRSLPAGWSIDPAEYRFTIPANDNSVQFAEPFEQTVEEDVGEVIIPLNVTGVPPTDGLPLRVEIAGHGRHADTATTDDYSFDPLAFTLMPAEAGEGYNLVFSITDDDLPETRETFAITLHAGEGFPTGWGGLGEKTTRYLTILENDKTIGFADTLPAELEEGTLNFPLEVVWNVGILDWERLRLGVELEKAAGGGTDPEEFDVLLEFPPDTFNEFQDTSHESDYLTYTGSAGSDTRIEINVQDDKLLEEDEEIVVRLVPKQESPLPDGWSIDPAEYRFTIPANDKFVGFAAADSSLVEPNGDPGAQVSGNVVVKLNGPAPAGGLNLVVSVDEETNDDGGNIDAEVTIGEGGVVFISEGATEISFPVTVLEDDIAESNEPVVLTLSKGANWPELWEIGGIADTGNLSGTHTVTILGNDKKVGFRDAVRKLVSEANYASVSPVVTNYPAPAGGLRLSVEVVPHTGLYARANVLEDGAKDLSYQENVRIRPNSRFEAVNSVAPLDDGIAEPDEAAVFRLSVAGGGQLPPGWEWSNQDLEVILLANDNDFTFTDGDNDDSKGSYSEGTTVRLTAVATNPLPPLESEEYYANFRTRVGYFGIEVTENSEDISITPVAPVIYHSDYHHPDGSRKGLSQPIKGGQEFFADYAFTVTEGDMNSLAFDVAIHEDSETEPPETVVITLSISGGWGLRPTTRQYTLTINDEGGTGMIGFSQAEIDRGPYALYEEASLSTQRPGVLVELSSPAPAGGIDLVMRSSDPGQLSVGGNIHVPENRKGCYVTQLPVSGGRNYHFPERRERCRFTDFNVVSDGTPEGDETYDIIISEDPARPLPPKWEIDSARSHRKVTIYSSDNPVGIAGFVDPDSASIPENGPIPIEMIKKSVSLDEDEGLARLVLNVSNDPVPGGLHLRLNVTSGDATPGEIAADLGIYPPLDFIIPRRNQAGSFQHVIEIPITDDTDTEQLESFLFTLHLRHASNAHNTWGYVDRGNDKATLKINQNDQTIQFYDSSVEIAEGPPGYAYLYFTSPALKPVPFMFHADTPIDGVNFASTLTVQVNDYEMKDLGQQQFHAWKFPISVVDDETSEGKQSFTLSVTPGTNFPKSHTLDPEHSSIEIIIPESDNLVSFMNVATEVNEDVGTVGVTLTLTNPAPAGGLPLRIDTVSVNAAGVISNDFDFVNGNEFTIMPEDGLQYTFTVNIDDDDLAENTETYDLVLQKRRNFPDGWGTLNERAAHPLTILENDQKISWAEESVEIIEGEEKPLILNFPSSIPEDAPARVSFRVENNSDRDISFPPSEVRISGAQASSYSLQVTANEDTDREGGETFIIVATGHDFPSSYAQDQEASIQVTIPANNNLVGFVGSSIEVEEDVGSINLTLNLTGDTPPSGLRMRLNISGQHQHADIGGTVSHNFTIPWRNETGSFQHVIPIPITDDDDTEDDKLITFGLSLLDNSWGEIDTNNDEFDLTILKNDQWFGFIAEPSVEIAEGTEEDVYLYFSEPVPHPATFMFHTDTPIDGVNFASTLTVEVEEYEMKELGGLEFHAWKFPISVTDDEITEGEQSFRLHVTSGPNVPDYYTVDPVESYIDIIIPGSDNLVDFKRGATSISKNTGKINVELRLTNPAPAGGLPLRIPALGGDADEIFDFKEYDNEFTILPIHGLEYTLGINIKNTKDIQFVNGQQSYHFTIEKSGEDFPDSWGTLGEQTLHILVIHE